MDTLSAALLPDTALALRGEVRAFLDEELAGRRFVQRCDAWLSGHDAAFSGRLAERGWIGMTWPRQLGGGGRTPLERFVVVEELLAAGAPIAAHWIADRQTGPGLMKYGTPAQRQHFLPAIARAECFFAIGMSEPDSGSDLGSIRTTARRDGEGWRLDGTKVWTSHAHLCHYAVVLARTAPGAQGHEGLSQLIVDLRTPGVEIRPIRHMSGEAHFSEMRFEAAHVPGDMLLGMEGNGWRQVMDELGFERSGPERFLSTFPLLCALVREAGDGADDRIAEVVGEAISELVTLRRMSLDVAVALQRGEDPAQQAAVVKELGTRFESDLVESVRRVAGASGAGSDSPLWTLLAQASLSAPNFTLRGGTNEILRGVIARGLGLR
jgi:acyl-CoA dehydrogenase